VPFDREETLKKAEKLLRQGRLDAAIAEYARVVEAAPQDWNTANALGDLLVRVGQLEGAAEQYGRIADHFAREGFYSKAAALYKKILKFHPDDEAAQLQLAEISATQGLMADAKAQFGAVAERRRFRGDRQGADEIAVRLGSLDPADTDARLHAARVLADGGSTTLAAERYRALSADLFEKNREADALSALSQAVRLDPGDAAGRAQLARAYLGMGDADTAREFLDRETAGDDPGLLIALAEVELRDGHLDAAGPIVKRVLELEPSMVNEVINIGWAFCQAKPEAAFLCIDAAAAVARAHGDYQTAASVLQEYVARATLQVPALLELVEVCVDGGLEATMYETQAQLCDAYLSGGQAAEARLIAEDLVAREPWESSHIQRFRQALVMLKVSDPDSIIAERLNGQVPFQATDHFPDADLGPVMPMPPEETPAAPRAATPQRAEPSKVEGKDAQKPAEEDVDLEALHRLLREVEGSDASATAMEVDLTGALLSLDAVEPQPPAAKSLDEAFARTRDTMARQPGAEEAAEQLRLGRTFIEMGMVDEAVKALAQAARSPRQRFEASSALGRLHKQRNEIPQALEWMERAAEAPAPSAEDGRALLYELGLTLEQSGENARALAVFLELLADAGSFRDVQARVDRLSRVETGS
jgi:tetratricopeptide (TPR) repeat protein